MNMFIICFTILDISSLIFNNYYIYILKILTMFESTHLEAFTECIHTIVWTSHQSKFYGL